MKSPNKSPLKYVQQPHSFDDVKCKNIKCKKVVQFNSFIPQSILYTLVLQ